MKFFLLDERACPPHTSVMFYMPDGRYIVGSISGVKYVDDFGQDLPDTPTHWGLLPTAPTPNRPALMDTPDLSILITTTEAIINEIVAGDWHEDNDDDHYIFEEAMKALYGKDFFVWYNKATDC